MPVVIALLNAYAGLAGSATGFALNNNILIIAGALATTVAKTTMGRLIVELEAALKRNA